MLRCLRLAGYTGLNTFLLGQQRRRAKTSRSAVDEVAIVIPVLNEAAVMPRLLRVLRILHPAPAEIIAADGGSQDNTVELVRQSGFVRLVEHAVRGRRRRLIGE
jgi:cellulose synthase/poly-beta-1,6-N-acetylglucosamine synthase-like glycosyltransferase